MTAWTIDDIKKRLADFGGIVGDLDDPKEQTRQRILDAASEQFERYGYRRASVEDVARAAGTGKGTVYLYFKSKKALLWACASREKSELIPEVQKILTLPQTQRLEAYLKLVIHFVLTAPIASAMVRGEREIAALLKEIGPEQQGDDLARALEFILSFIAPVTPNVSAARRETLARTLLTVVNLPAHLVNSSLRYEQNNEDFIATYAGILARGIATTEPES